ncbi:hypothetical protein L345_16405, partial [Ophiophagus hannah]
MEAKGDIPPSPSQPQEMNDLETKVSDGPRGSWISAAIKGSRRDMRVLYWKAIEGLPQNGERSNIERRRNFLRTINQWKEQLQKLWLCPITGEWFRTVMANLWHACHKWHPESSLQAHKPSPQLSSTAHARTPPAGQLISGFMMRLRRGWGQWWDSKCFTTGSVGVALWAWQGKATAKSPVKWHWPVLRATQTFPYRFSRTGQNRLNPTSGWGACGRHLCMHRGTLSSPRILGFYGVHCGCEVSQGFRLTETKSSPGSRGILPGSRDTHKHTHAHTHKALKALDANSISGVILGSWNFNRLGSPGGCSIAPNTHTHTHPTHTPRAPTTEPRFKVSESPLLPVEGSCSIFPNDTQRCGEPKNRFFYNITSKSCEPFVYHGCPGNRNRYHTIEECQRYCGHIGEFGCRAGRSLWDR